MTQRLLYLRRGVTWVPVLGCCVTAAAAALLLQAWPTTATIVLPALLAACAAGAAHLFDEPAAPVVSVTPRGTRWRGSSRLAATGVPLLVWGAVVAVRPGDLGFSQPGWLLLGCAVILLATGISALASRHDTPAPGHALAGMVVVAVVGPVIFAGFLDLTTPYPLTGFPDGVRTFWTVVAALAAVACLGPVRSGLRR